MFQGLEFEYEAFMELNTCRPGESYRPLPWTAIVEYASFHGLDQEDTEDFIRMMRAMDEVWLEYQNAQAEAKRKQAEAKVAKPARKPRRK